jgi:hypothetical protein
MAGDNHHTMSFAKLQRLQEFILPAGITLFFMALSYYLHQHDGTALVLSEEIWIKKIRLSMEYYPFSARYFTDYSIFALRDLFGLQSKTCFLIVQYSLFFVLGVTFYSMLRALGFSIKSAISGLVILLASYPILCAFVLPVHTYDDFWQYIATVVAFLLVLKNRPLWASVVFAIGALAREPILLFYPILLYAAFTNCNMSRRDKIVMALVPIAVYGLYALFTFQSPEDVRFHNFDKNFLDADWAKNSLFSLIISFGFVWVTAYVAIIAIGRRIMEDARKSFVLVGATVLVPLLIVVTLTMTLARETRIFFPPFVFLIPLTLWVFEEYREQLVCYYRKYFGLLGLATGIAVTWFGIMAARALFPSFDFRGMLEFTQVYFGIHIALTLLFLIPLALALIKHIVKTQRASEDSLDSGHTLHLAGPPLRLSTPGKSPLSPDCLSLRSENAATADSARSCAQSLPSQGARTSLSNVIFSPIKEYVSNGLNRIETFIEYDPEKSRYYFVFFTMALLAAVVTLFREFIFSDLMMYGTDTIKAGIFFRSFLVEHVRSTGTIPLWNPYIMGGLPFVDAFHGDIFYPLSVFKFFGALTRMLGYILILHVCLAGIFMYLTAREVGLSRVAATLSGVVYALAPYTVSFVAAGNDGKLFVTALFPLAILFLHRAFRRSPLVNFTMLGVVIGVIILTPHPQMSYYVLLCLAAYGIYRLIDMIKEHRALTPAVKPALLLVYAVVLGLAISAIQMLPGYNYTMNYSPRTGSHSGLGFAQSWALHEEEVVSLIVPEFAGVDSPADRNLHYWGKNGWKDNSESVGAVGMFLALLSLWFYKRKGYYFWGVLALVFLLYGLGGTTPVFKLLYYAVPLLSKLRAPSMGMFVFLFVTSLLAGSFIQSLIDNRVRYQVGNRQWFGGVIWILPVMLFAGGLLFAAAGEEMLRLYSRFFYPDLFSETGRYVKKLAAAKAYLPYVRDGLYNSAALAAAAAFVVWLFLKTRLSPVFLFAIPILIAADDIRFNQRFVSLVDAETYVADTELVQFLRNKKDHARVIQYPYGGNAGYNLYVRTGIASPVGNHGNELRWYRDLLFHGGFRKNYFNPRFVNLLGVGYVITYTGTRIPVDTLGATRMDTTAVYGEYALLRNQNCLPRAFLVDRYEVIPDRKDIYPLVLDGTADLRQLVYLEEEPELDIAPNCQAQACAAIKHYGVDSVAIEIDCSDNMLLILTDNYYPAWQAFVDGDRRKILRAYGSFRAVDIPAGTREVVFKYDSQTYRLGKLLTIFGLVVALGVLLSAPLRKLKVRRLML